MFCSNCGNQLPDQAKFCAKCGQPVEPEESPAENGSRPPQGDPAGTADTKQTASRTADTSAAQSSASVSEEAGLYNPDAWKKYAHGEPPNALTARYTNRREEAGLYNPDTWKENKKGGRDLAKQARGTLYAGRVLVPISFVLLIISCFVPALTFGATAYGYRYFRAPGMLYGWFLAIWRANIEPDTFNIFFWVVIGLIAVAVILPVFFVKSNRKGSGWIILGCVLLWVLFLAWILCIVQLNIRRLFSYTAGLGYYLLGAAVVLDTVGTAMYTHRSY